MSNPAIKSISRALLLPTILATVFATACEPAANSNVPVTPASTPVASPSPVVNEPAASPSPATKASPASSPAPVTKKGQ